MLELAKTHGENDEFGKLRISLTTINDFFWLAVQANLFGMLYVSRSRELLCNRQWG